MYRRNCWSLFTLSGISGFASRDPLRVAASNTTHDKLDQNQEVSPSFYSIPNATTSEPPSNPRSSFATDKDLYHNSDRMTRHISRLEHSIIAPMSFWLRLSQCSHIVLLRPFLFHWYILYFPFVVGRALCIITNGPTVGHIHGICVACLRLHISLTSTSGLGDKYAVSWSNHVIVVVCRFVLCAGVFGGMSRFLWQVINFMNERCLLSTPGPCHIL